MDRFSHLLIETGVKKGTSYVVPPEGARLGRSVKNDFAIDDENLSRHHSEFFFKNGNLWVRDLDSSNRTLLNQKPIEETQLKKGDRISLGDTQILVLLSTEKPKIRLQKELAPPPRLTLDRASPAVKALSIPLWLCMLAWFIFLAYSLMRESVNRVSDKDVNAHVESTPLDIASTPDNALPHPTENGNHTPRPANVPDTSSDAGPIASTRTEPEKQARASTPARIARDPADAEALSDGPSDFDALARSIIFRILRQEYESAQEDLLDALVNATTAEEQDAIKQASALVRAASDVDKKISDALSLKLGETITMTKNDEPITVHVVAISGDIVKGNLETGGGMKSISFRISSIPPLEQSRMLGKPVTSEDAFVKCMLHLKGTDYEGAAQYVSHCGVFKPTISDMLATLR